MCVRNGRVTTSRFRCHMEVVRGVVVAVMARYTTRVSTATETVLLSHGSDIDPITWSVAWLKELTHRYRPGNRFCGEAMSATWASFGLALGSSVTRSWYNRERS
ncbi:hypothetical protein GCM10017778_32520 [Streptomyces vinaceus]|nr:hypothetical protein GCM10017778_32520 [Streptomyces vinaceus]